MWNLLSRLIIRYRVLFILVIAGITAFMLYSAIGVRLSYSMVKILPEDHQVYVDYSNFQEKYGKQNVVAIAIEDADIQEITHFKDWAAVSSKIKNISGVEQVISITELPLLHKDTVAKKFYTQPWYDSLITTQNELDSAFDLFLAQPFYKGLLVNEENHATALMIKLNHEVILTPERAELIFSIKAITDAYAEKYNAPIHYSGLPYIRTVDSIKIKNEMSVFIILTLLITSCILFLFFRSFKAAIASMVVVIVSVIWAFGTMAILDYEISILMALVPPVLIVIGIPNCIFLINKFHNEFKQHKNKVLALKRMVLKVGNITLLTNLTTASGFAAFMLTKSQTLQEFGAIASLNILFIFLLSLFIIPIFFSFASPPKKRHIKHLDQQWVLKIVAFLIYLVQHKRRMIYVVTIALTLIGAFGISLVKTTGNLTDDLPKEGKLFQDLKFFEYTFGGVMPLELIVDTKKKNGLLKSYNLQKIEKLSNVLEGYQEFSKPTSYIDFVKYSKQAFYNGDTAYYSLPNSQEQRMLMPYLSNSWEGVSVGSSLMDEERREARLSLRMADISTSKMDSIFEDLMPKIDAIFDSEKYDVTVTGTSIVFLNGTKFLIKNLILSLLLVIILISIFMAWMFTSFRMVVVSIVPNLIPLLLTGAIMGYFGIALKPSTILVFSIAFGISVDDTIHFLAKYRQELLANNWHIKKSVLAALQETGVSMFYTSVVLFFGFFIFIASDFGGTIALGLLVSITLLLAMLANLLLLPALLLSLEKAITTESFNEPLIDIFDEEEDVELAELKVKQKIRK